MVLTLRRSGLEGMTDPCEPVFTQEEADTIDEDPQQRIFVTLCAITALVTTNFCLK